MKVVLRFGSLDILVSSTSFQKSNIDWSQQPPTKKMLKFNLMFPDSTKKVFLSKYQNKVEFKNLDDTEVLSNDFLGLRTSAVSMTCTASTTSLASMTFWPLQPHFIKKKHWTWWLEHLWHPNDQYRVPFSGSSRIQIFTDIWTLSVGG